MSGEQTPGKTSGEQLSREQTSGKTSGGQVSGEQTSEKNIQGISVRGTSVRGTNVRNSCQGTIVQGTSVPREQMSRNKCPGNKRPGNKGPPPKKRSRRITLNMPIKERVATTLMTIVTMTNLWSFRCNKVAHLSPFESITIIFCQLSIIEMIPIPKSVNLVSFSRHHLKTLETDRF